MSFTYNDEGIRTSKTVNGEKHVYRLDGSRIIAEEENRCLILYLYDGDGSPIGMRYRNSAYGADIYDTYWFEKNLQGDIVAVYDEDGTKLIAYTYDAWGNVTTTYSNGGASSTARFNPFRYRGYYYDSELGMYYLQSRYYDPVIGRFISADTAITGTSGSLLSYNAYGYDVANFANAGAASCSILTNRRSSDYVVAPDKIELVVQYNVPLYSQGNLNLCWAYCQIMVEDYQNGVVSTQNQANIRAKALAILVNGEKDQNGNEIWNNGAWPTNCLRYDVYGTPMQATRINSIYDLYFQLVNGGPLYVYYCEVGVEDPSAHLVVVTGVNLSQGIVYTNNPWGYLSRSTDIC